MQTCTKIGLATFRHLYHCHESDVAQLRQLSTMLWGALIVLPQDGDEYAIASDLRSEVESRIAGLLGLDVVDQYPGDDENHPATIAARQKAAAGLAAIL